VELLLLVLWLAIPTLVHLIILGVWILHYVVIHVVLLVVHHPLLLLLLLVWIALNEISHHHILVLLLVLRNLLDWLKLVLVVHVLLTLVINSV